MFKELQGFYKDDWKYGNFVYFLKFVIYKMCIYVYFIEFILEEALWSPQTLKDLFGTAWGKD